MYLRLGLVSCDKFVNASHTKHYKKSGILLSVGLVTSCMILLQVAPHCPTPCV